MITAAVNAGERERRLDLFGTSVRILVTDAGRLGDPRAEIAAAAAQAALAILVEEWGATADISESAVALALAQGMELEEETGEVDWLAAAQTEVTNPGVL